MGLYRRKNSPYWWANYRMDGKKLYLSTKTKKRKLAERIYASWITQINEGKWLGKKPSYTFGELCDRYENEKLHKLKDTVRAKGIIKHLKNYFGTETLLQEIENRVHGYEQYRANICPGTFVREMGVLKRMFNIARKNWKWIQVNPVDFVDMPTVDDARIRYLVGDEAFELQRNAPAWLWEICSFARQTGLRRSNIVSLEETNINFRNETLTVESVKTGKMLTLPLTQTALRILDRRMKLRPINSKYVFTDEGGRPHSPAKITTAFGRLVKKAKVKDLRFHDLRHDFASNLAQAGVDLNRIRELLGQMDLRMTQRYAHLKVEHLRDDVRKLDEKRLHNGYTTTVKVKEEAV